jgi:hypothetical protein
VDEQHRDHCDVFPLGMAVLAELGRGRNNDPVPAVRHGDDARDVICGVNRRHGYTGGTPPNLIGKGLLLKNAGIDISFGGGWRLVCCWSSS